MKIAIVGAGAAGMMAAATILESGRPAEIFVIERNAVLGRKVVISGGGRCNVTTGVTPLRRVFDFYPRGARFLRTAMHTFPPEAVYEWFESHGVPLKIEDDLRVFPQSNDGKDIVGVFERLFADSGVQVLTQHAVEQVARTNDGFTLTLSHKKEQSMLHVDALILTTGGQAYRHTGSVGDGYTFAEALGHHVTPLGPSLNSLHTSTEWPKTMSGVSFERVRFTATSPTDTYTFTGPFVFTHTGISGPAVFALSAYIAFEKCSKQEPLLVRIDFVSDRSDDEIRQSIEQAREQHPQQLFVHTVHAYLPKRIAEVACAQVGIDLQKTNQQVSNKEKNKMVEWMKRCPLDIVGRGAGSEFVTAGGVELSEVNPQTMESRITPRLYFAGELLNVDGFTGGFNLQASWATGRLAGSSIVQRA